MARFGKGKQTDTAVADPTFTEPTYGTPEPEQSTELGGYEYPTYETPNPDAGTDGDAWGTVDTPIQVTYTEDGNDTNTGTDTQEGQTQTKNQETETVATKAENKAEKGKRAPRPAINVGEVIVAPSTRTNFTTRATPMDNNPVYLAVKNAELDTPYDLHVDEDKVAGVVSILRRSGARLGVGVHIASAPYPQSDQREGAVILTFKTGERQVRPAKSETVAVGDAASE